MYFIKQQMKNALRSDDVTPAEKTALRETEKKSRYINYAFYGYALFDTSLTVLFMMRNVNAKSITER